MAHPRGGEAELADAAREAALRLLTARARTRAELEQRLAEQGFPHGTVAATLDRLEQVGLVDDAAVAASYAERRAGWGGATAGLAAELRRRGIDAEVAGAAAGSATAGEDEVDRCRRVAESRLARLGNLPPEVQGRRLAGFLARRGYPPDTVEQVLQELVAVAPHAPDVG